MKNNWIWTTWVAFLLVVSGLMLLIFFAFNKAFNDWSGQINSEVADHFGSLISGVVGSLFSLAGFFLIYETIIKQQNIFNIQQFENRFFELVRYHRENVQQLKYRLPYENGEIIAEGAKYFAEIVDEFDCLYLEVEENLKQKFSQKQIIEITALCHFFGVTQNSKTNLLNALSNYDHDLMMDLIDNLYKKKTKYDDAIVYYGGHEHRLGHYFRHLAQVFKFVEGSTFTTDKEKYNYIKLYRAQLSSFEIKYFFYNSLCIFGEKWHSSGMVDKYQIFKNLPKEMSNKILPKNYCPNVVFDWEEGYK